MLRVARTRRLAAAAARGGIPWARSQERHQRAQVRLAADRDQWLMRPDNPVPGTGRQKSQLRAAV